jgi:hypothetical protein
LSFVLIFYYLFDKIYYDVEKIVERIEDFIKRKGINYYEIEKRYINSLDILLYCAYNLIKNTFKGYFYTQKENKYFFTEKYMKSFNMIKTGEYQLLNSTNIAVPSEIFKIDRP